MTRLPKKRGITQVEEDKSLIRRKIYFMFCRWAGDNPIKDVRDFA
jgi:hypothetical protein